MLAYSAWPATRLLPITSSPTEWRSRQPAQVKALSHPMRNTILGLLHERAATVTELAAALGGRRARSRTT